jgi:GTPase SAR1 family protein
MHCHRIQSLEDRVIENGGALITGPAGTGKTHFVNRLVSRWKEREQVQFILGAPTHMAARLLRVGASGGHTLEHLRRRYRHRCPQNCVFVIDEISQVPLSMLSVLARFHHFGARFVLVGDFDGQFRPVADAWPAARPTVDTALLKKMAGCLHIELTQNRRAEGDDEHFRRYCELYPYAENMSWLLVRQATARYPWRGEEPSVVLVLSHKKRLLVNAYYNRLRDGDGVLVPSVGEIDRAASQPQDMFLKEGMLLLGCGDKKKKILNGTEYVVREIGEDRVVVQSAPEYGGGDPIALNFEDASRYLRLRYAMCYFTVQGRTFKDHILLLDKQSPHFSVRHLIVGLSRVTAGRLAHIPTRTQEEKFLDRLA